MDRLVKRVARRGQYFIKVRQERQAKQKMIAFYRQFIEPGDLCFDVGANIGNRTDIFLALGARVVCIEPQPSCVAILAKKYNNDSRVSIIPEGLAETQGTL